MQPNRVSDLPAFEKNLDSFVERAFRMLFFFGIFNWKQIDVMIRLTNGKEYVKIFHWKIKQRKSVVFEWKMIKKKLKKGNSIRILINSCCLIWYIHKKLLSYFQFQFLFLWIIYWLYTWVHFCVFPLKNKVQHFAILNNLNSY